MQGDREQDQQTKKRVRKYAEREQRGKAKEQRRWPGGIENKAREHAVREFSEKRGEVLRKQRKYRKGK